MRRPDEPSERLRRILDGVEDARATDPADGDPDLGPDLLDAGARDAPVLPPPRPLTLPSGIATARWRVRPRAVLGVALLLAVAVTVLGVRLHLAQRDALPQAAPATSGGPAVVASGDRSGFETGVGTEPAPSGTAPAGAPPAAEVYVHVVGRVRSLPRLARPDRGTSPPPDPAGPRSRPRSFASCRGRRRGVRRPSRVVGGRDSREPPGSGAGHAPRRGE